MKKLLLALLLLFTTATVVEARCNTLGTVQGLDYYGDNFLSVRTGPGTRYREIDRLYSGDVVYICRWRGKWLNVKYSAGRYGWVYGKYIRVRY
jgi:uncharacterized protein YraI